MRRLFFIVWLGLAISNAAQSPRSAGAAIVEGRVVDSDGEPLARAEVRIWQKIRGVDGRFADRPVDFDNSDVLTTNAEGRFVSPDVLVAGQPAQIVAEAAGMIAGRSGWIAIAQDAIVVEAETDIELAKMLSRYDRDLARALLEPLAASVFATDRPQTQTLGGRAGKIFLAAMHVDPRWAKSLLDAIADSPTSNELAESSRFHFVWTLSIPLSERWNGPHEYCAGFWEPSAKETPLPP